MLKEQQVEDYRERGFLAPLRIMGDQDAAEYRKLYEESVEERITADSLGLDHKAAASFDIREFQPHLYFPWAARLLQNRELISSIQQLLGKDVLVWETQIFAKPANSTGFIAWHQDLTYWGLDLEYEEITAWIALSASTPESGCMRVVPGSHHRDIVEHVQKDTQGSLLSLGQELAVSVDEETAVDLVLQPGEMSLHHGKIFHGSQGNQSSDARIGFAVRCIPTKARPVEGKQYATLLSGRDVYRHFSLLSPAAGRDLSREEVDALAIKLHNPG